MIDYSQMTRFEQGMFLRDRDVPKAKGTLLYIHGLGESGLCFEHLLDSPRLIRWRQLIPDLPGYGRSPWTKSPLTLEDQADYVATWLHASESDFDISPLVVIGHSMGGVIGLLLCERFPNLAAILIDVDGNKSPDDCVFSGKAASQRLEQFIQGGFDALRLEVFSDSDHDPARRGYYVSMRLADPRAFHLNSCELIQKSEKKDMAERLSNLSIPSHYIAGVPEGASKQTLQLLDEAGVQWTGIEPSGHWPFIDQTERFVDLILEITEEVCP
jgi:pimeloyl-ACP methyl ester carboxylesterase